MPVYIPRMSVLQHHLGDICLIVSGMGEFRRRVASMLHAGDLAPWDFNSSLKVF